MKKRKDGRYATSVTVGYDDTGKRILVTVYGRTKSELELNKAQIMLDVKKKIYVKDKSVTFGEYSKKWLKKKNVEIADVSMYDEMLRLHTADLDDLPLTEITQDDCQDLINKVKDKPRTCQKIKITLNQVFESAIQANLMYRNPSKGISLPKYRSKPKRPLTASEKVLLDACVFTQREQMYIDLIRYYGLRKEEALALKKEDFDFEAETIQIRHATKFVGNTPTEKETKNGEERTLFMLPGNRLEFMAFIISCDDSDPHIFRSLSVPGWITHQSFRCMYDSIMDKMRKKAKELNIEPPQNLTSHIFRHGYATDLYYAGVGLKDAQYLLGHKTASVTMNIYTHLDKKQTDARKKLQEYYQKQSQ